MKKWLSIILAGCFVFSLAACGNPKTDAPKEEADATSLEDQRVVATSVSIVEILDTLGVPVVGVPTSSYSLPDSAKDAAEIGNPMSPDMETIKSLDPTLVFSVTSLEPTLKSEFEAIHIPAAFLNLNSFEGLLQSIETIGEATNTSEKAEKTAEDIKTRADAVSKKAEGRESPDVLIIFGVSGEFQVATEKSYVGDLVKRAGGTNIIENPENSFIPVDMEFLAEKDPDYILLMTHANPEETKAAFEKEFSENAAWDNFSAVKNDHVISLETSYFGMSANLLAPDALEKLEAMFYGEE